MIRFVREDLFPGEASGRPEVPVELVEVTDPGSPAFDQAHALLAEVFGPDELESEDALRGFLREDSSRPLPSGTFARYLLVLARDAEGRPCGVRDAVILANPRTAPGLCLVYLARIAVAPRARGTTVAHALRSAPLEVARRWLASLSLTPETFVLSAEMAYVDPAEPESARRLTWYGRGGFAALSPARVPYVQPDLGGGARPYLLVVRRVGREREPVMPHAEAVGVLRLLCDDFGSFCPEDAVLPLRRLSERVAADPAEVELWPLVLGTEALLRATVLERWYAVTEGGTAAKSASPPCPSPGSAAAPRPPGDPGGAPASRR